MALIRPIADIRDKWVRVTPGRREEYGKGVVAPLRDWEKGAIQASDAWKHGVEEAVAEDRFEKGVKKAGIEKWSRKAKEVGVERWPRGVQVAGPDYEVAFAPYRDEIEKITLPPRGPKGDPGNLRRVEAVAMALRKKKLELLK